MLINDKLINELLNQAANSPRLRINMDLRNSTDDKSQRMLNALMPGTVLPIHRHTNSSEVVILLKGRLEEVYYDGEGSETKRIVLAQSTGNYALSIPIGQWHNIIVLEPSVIYESKDGEYKSLSSEDILQNK